MDGNNDCDVGTKSEEAPPKIVTDVPLAPVDETAPTEPPVKPEWTPGKIGILARRLLKIAGVDLPFAEKMPADEQAQMRRVGMAMVFGSSFLFCAVLTALSAGSGFDWWTVPVGIIVTGVVLALDLKFVGGHWMVQGQAYCRAHGLMPDGGWQDRFKRIAQIACRWTLSGFIAFTLATLVLLKYFESDIVNHWEEQHRQQTRPIIAEMTARYGAQVGEFEDHLAASDKRLEALDHERQQVSETGNGTTADLDRQIDGHLDRVKKLEADKDTALQAKALEQGDTVAEHYGVRARDNNTGHHGKGDYYYFADDMAKQYDATAKSIAVEIDAETKAIEDLRRERAGALAASRASVQGRLDQIERQTQEETANRAALAAEFRRFQDGREEWISAHVTDSPAFVPMPHGILAELEALAAIILGSPLIASMVFFTKGLIMLLESAGPLAKVAFTAPGMYQMQIALRLHDATEMEADRRINWDHWRLVTRGRHQEAIDAINARRQRRTTASHTRDALNKIIERTSWLH